MKWNKTVCLGFTITLTMLACEPPARVTSPAPGSSAFVHSSAKPLVATSTMPPAERLAPMASALASAPLSAPAPCPPEVPAPAGMLAWVSGCKIVLGEKIHFDFDKSTIKPQSYPLLDAVGDILAKDTDLFIEIQGHLGEPERQAYSRKLSQNRARSVMEFLIKRKGIAYERLEARGYEASMPIADWKTGEGRAQNRRIEFVIWKWRGGTSRAVAR